VRDLKIVDVFEAIGARAAGTIDDTEVLRNEDHACPGAGACGGQYTANTMAMALEMLGLSPLGSSSVPAVVAGTKTTINDRRKDLARRVGSQVLELLARNARPRDFLTRD